jgi:hypothetical protein
MVCSSSTVRIESGEAGSPYRHPERSTIKVYNLGPWLVIGRLCLEENDVATKKKSSHRRYGKAAGKKVASAIRREKHGTLRSGKSGKGGQVKSRKQAIAIGLSEARKKGAKVPRKS